MCGSNDEQESGTKEALDRIDEVREPIREAVERHQDPARTNSTTFLVQMTLYITKHVSRVLRMQFSD